MIGWDQFIYFAILAALLWVVGAVSVFFQRRRWLATIISASGTAVLLAFIVMMWVFLQRPPMRTMGETRLWYSFFLSIVGLSIYAVWQYKWILSYGAGMSIMFLSINLFKPEIHSKVLMPALQSPWFVPHVTVYMFAYAILGAATLYAIYLWIRRLRVPATNEEMKRCDILVRIGWAFLSMGMAMGALWAKQAWGDWWTWDPKETWALATWLCYLLYMHVRSRIKDQRYMYALLVLAFLMLCMCWFGVNILPSAKAVSIHAY